MRVGEDELLSILQALIRAKSPDPPGDVSACTALLSELLTKEGIPFEVDESKPGIQNIVATLRGSKGRSAGGKSLMLNGHIDVIPAGSGWTVDPYGAHCESGYMYGRGTVDMKSGIAAMVAAMVSLKRSGAPFSGTLLLVAVGDEEYHSEFGTKYLLRKGLRADYAICGEPTNLGMDLGNRGLLMIEVIVKGKASHAGRPALGTNAVHIACSAISELSKVRFTQHHNEAFEIPDGSLSIVEIHGGEKINVIPDSCSFYIDRRLMPGESSALATEEVARLIREITEITPDIGADKGSSIVILPESWHEPCWTPPESPIAVSAVKSIKELFGSAPKIGGKAAGTDASHLVSMANIPTVLIGPGDCKLSHTVGERVLISQVADAARLYEAIALDILR